LVCAEPLLYATTGTGIVAFRTMAIVTGVIFAGLTAFAFYTYSKSLRLDAITDIRVLSCSKMHNMWTHVSSVPLATVKSMSQCNTYVELEGDGFGRVLRTRDEQVRRLLANRIGAYHARTAPSVPTPHVIQSSCEHNLWPLEMKNCLQDHLTSTGQRLLWSYMAPRSVVIRSKLVEIAMIATVQAALLLWAKFFLEADIFYIAVSCVFILLMVLGVPTRFDGLALTDGAFVIVTQRLTCSGFVPQLLVNPFDGKIFPVASTANRFDAGTILFTNNSRMWHTAHLEDVRGVEHALLEASLAFIYRPAQPETPPMPPV